MRRTVTASGRLSTHVLDTAAGRPAAGVTVQLRDPDELLATATTSADGRALLLEDGLRAGPYELAFAIGAYFAATGTPTADPPFLDVVVVRFSVSDPGAHHHVPLLATPWSYSVYRGS
jgi:5-hydroxyisourate hydrolase